MVRYCVILQTMRTIQYVSSERGGWVCFCQIHLQSTLSLITMNTWIFNWHFFCSYAVFACISADSDILRSLELKVRMCVLTGACVSGIYVQFPRKIRSEFWLQTAQNGKMPRLVPLRSFGEKQFKKHNFSNELSLVLFQGCRYAQYVLFVFAVFAIMYHVFVYMCPIFSYVLITVGIYTC